MRRFFSLLRFLISFFETKTKRHELGFNRKKETRIAVFKGFFEFHHTNETSFVNTSSISEQEPNSNKRTERKRLSPVRVHMIEI